MRLFVKSPFDGKNVGDVVTDAAEVEAILADHREAHVIRFGDAKAEPKPTKRED
jgi:hypothetical protein